MTAIDLNSDLGESYGAWAMGDDEAMLSIVSSANVACGFHASDPVVMMDTVKLCAANGVSIGAHPGFADLQGFGRREMKMGREEMANCLIYQIGALCGFLKAEGMELNHIKPHGSLYGMAARQEDIAQAVCDAADVFKVPLLGMTGTLHETVYPARGHGFVAEFYADLEYRPDGSLIVTREHDAKDPALMAARCVRAITEGKGTATNGADIPVRCDSICIHSDTPNAIDIARAVRAAVQPYT